MNAPIPVLGAIDASSLVYLIIVVVIVVVLDAQHVAQLIRSKLAQMLGAEAEAPAALVDLVAARAQETLSTSKTLAKRATSDRA